MTTLKLQFSDMWGYEQYLFNSHDNYFTDLFSLKYKVEIVDENPDLLIYSVFGQNYKKFNCKKIFFTGENYSKEYFKDYYESSNVNLSHYDSAEKDILCPLWVIFLNWFNKDQPRPLPSNPTYTSSFSNVQDNRERFLTDRKFAAFINNNGVADRVELFDKLSEYKRVDSFGKLKNNMGRALRGSELDKINVLRDYKFTIAFENSHHSGYNTEKIIHPFDAGCIPIYKGGERVLKYFNKNSFIYANDYKNVDELVERVKEIDYNDSLYKDMVLEKPLKMDEILNDFEPFSFLEKIENKLNL